MPIRKKGDVEIQASANGTKVRQTGYTFYSYDKNSAALYFQFRGQDGQPTDLVNATVHLVMILDDDGGKKFIPGDDGIEVISAIRGTAKYVLPEMLLSYEGKVTGYVYMDFDDGSQSDDGQFTFRIRHSMITHVLPELGDKYVRDFEDVKEQVEQAGDSATKDIEKVKDNAESQIGDYVGEVESAKDSAVEDIDKALLVDEAKNYTDDKVEEFNETITTQLAQKANQEAVQSSLILKRDKSNPIGVNDLDGETLGILENGTGGTPVEVLSIPRDYSVTKEKTTFLKTGKNLFNRDDALEEHTISTSTGKANSTPGSGGIVSDYIPVSPATNYYYSDRNKSAVNVIYSYDSEKNAITDSSAQGVNLYETNSSASFVRFYTTGVASDIQFEQGTEPTPYEPYGYEFNRKIAMDGEELRGSTVSGEKIKPKTIGTDLVDFIKTGKNKFNKNTRTVGRYISNSLGDSASSATYDTTDFIFVEFGKTYTTSHRIRKYLFYNLQRQPISDTYIGDSKTGAFSFTPSEDGFVKISLWTSDAEVFQIEEGTQPTTYEPYMLEMPNLVIQSAEAENVLFGKSIANTGDSIAAGEGSTLRTYGKIIADNNNMNFQSWAEHGASIGEHDTRDKITEQIDAIVASGVQYDYVLVNGGTNDSNSPLGEITAGYDDVLDKSSFSGGLEYIFKTLRTNLPEAKIIFVRVHNMSSRTISSQKTIGERSLEVCEKWSIPYVDLFKEGQLNTNITLMKDNYTLKSDGTHPTYEGYELYYVPQIEDKMRSI